MVHWGAPNCPGCRGGEGGPEDRTPALGLQKRKVRARCVRVQAALQPAPLTLGRSPRGRSRASLPAHVRCPAPSWVAEWDPGRRGSGAAHQLGETPGSIPAHAFPVSLSRCEVYPAVGPGLRRQGVRGCQSSPRGSTPFSLTNSSPLRPGALSLPLKISPRCSTPQAGASRIFLSVQGSPGCPANPSHGRDRREGDRCTEQWTRRPRRNSQSPASRRCALRSGQRGLSGAPLAQVPHSSPRDSPPSRETDRPAANGEARLSGI